MVLFNTLEMDYCDQGKGWFGCWSQTMTCACLLFQMKTSRIHEIFITEVNLHKIFSP